MGACILVDENDNIIGRGESNNLKLGERIRITATWVRSPEDKILMALRSKHKKHQPNLWGPAVAGTVEPGEEYIENALKEMEEELGVTGVTLSIGPKTVTKDRVCQWYFASIPENTLLKLRLGEVDETRWFTEKELAEFYLQHPERFTPNAGKYFPLFIKL